MGSPLIAAFLAWRVTRGSALSRGLVIIFTIGVIQRLLWGADLKSGGLVSLGEDLRSVPCTTPPSASPAPCVALAQGFPVHFLSAAPDGNAAFPIIYKGAAAEEMAVWTVLSFAACYVIWLPSGRPAEALAARAAARV